MSFTIGRVEFEWGPNSGSIVHSGDQIGFVVEIHPDTLAEAKVMRQQMLGHLGETIPVVWSDDDGWDDDVLLAVIRLSLGDALFHQVYPDSDIRP